MYRCFSSVTHPSKYSEDFQGGLLTWVRGRGTTVLHVISQSRRRVRHVGVQVSNKLVWRWVKVNDHVINLFSSLQTRHDHHWQPTLLSLFESALRTQRRPLLSHMCRKPCYGVFDKTPSWLLVSTTFEHTKLAHCIEMPTLSIPRRENGDEAHSLGTFHLSFQICTSLS